MTCARVIYQSKTPEIGMLLHHICSIYIVWRVFWSNLFYVKLSRYCSSGKKRSLDSCLQRFVC